ncbi:DNA polymerase/3'-5' exonuclease PolX [Phycisphaerae bacterium RAS1]|nr:DNA polymerase/3'-5' exonuclease PolX [Phycisphaerae bacterium RAS1]
MTNADVARVFTEVADLMEIKGEDGFRVNSYRRVARTIDGLTTEVRELAARPGELEKLPGIGKGSATKIQELLKTGRLTLRDELTAEVPESLLTLRAIPGVGPKKIAMLWRERGVTTLEQLKAAIDGGQLAGIKGVGDKMIEQMRRGLEFAATAGRRTRLGRAWELAEELKFAVAELAGVKRVEHAGSLRRGVETVGDLDLLCVADDGGAVVAGFVKLSQVSQVLVAGETKGSVVIEYRPGRQIQVDLRVVPGESFGAAWQYFTGSKEHNVRLRERAQKRAWSLNEYGLTDGKKVIASRSEEEIYAALDLPWIPPELREDRGELDLKKVPEDLLKLSDIRGDLHMHTSASDGTLSIEETIAAAKARGYEYICITDHSQSSVVANGLTPQRLEAHVAAVRTAAKKVRGITVWVGAEVDILKDRLDYSDELLEKLDFVVASVHAGMSHDAAANTRRTLTAIENRFVNLIAHPTGRLINRREPMPLEMDTVIAAAVRTGTALEINANPLRLDLKDHHVRMAREAGATICIDCDAHSTPDFDNMHFGVTTARRAWTRKGEVLNARGADEVREFVKRKRRRT